MNREGEVYRNMESGGEDTSQLKATGWQPVDRAVTRCHCPETFEQQCLKSFFAHPTFPVTLDKQHISSEMPADMLEWWICEGKRRTKTEKEKEKVRQMFKHIREQKSIAPGSFDITDHQTNCKQRTK